MATNFSPCKGSYVLNQFPSNVMFGMNGFHVSASGAIQGHHGPLVSRNSEEDLTRNISVKFHENPISSFIEKMFKEKVNTRMHERTHDRQWTMT